MSLNKSKGKSVIVEALEKKEKVDYEGNFKVSFEHYDKTQPYGSSFKDWQKVGLLSKAFETLQGYCCSPLEDQLGSDKFGTYKRFPKPTDTLYKYPPMVPPDAKWAKLHITGPAVIIGHIVQNTFYVVFLDKTHKFWLTKRAKGEL